MTDPMFKTTAEAIAALQDAMETANQNAAALRTEFTSERKTDRRIYIGGLLLALVLFSTVLYSIHGTHQLLAVLADCTAEGGKCKQQSNARLGAAITRVTQGVAEETRRTTIYMGQCARLYPDISGPAYDVALERCVLAKLAENRPLGQAPKK